MIKIDEIETIQIDITTLCNALCVHCPRTTKSMVDNQLTLSINPSVPLVSIDQDAIASIINDDQLVSLKSIVFVPSYGDPLMVTDFLKIVQQIKNKDLKIVVHTNGSIRSPQFFKQLANILTDKDVVIFSIDGLEDTNHLYRKGVKWDKVISNAKAFNQAGGKSVWKAIKFKHNEHQFEEMERLSNEMGFNSFRFANNLGPELTDEEISCTNITQTQLSSPIGSVEYLETPPEIPTECPWEINKQIFIDINLVVWPCCYFGNSIFANKKEKRGTIERLHNLYGTTFNSLKHNLLSDILDHEFFQELSESGFRSPICYDTCVKRKDLINIDKNVKNIRF